MPDQPFSSKQLGGDLFPGAAFGLDTLKIYYLDITFLIGVEAALGKLAHERNHSSLKSEVKLRSGAGILALIPPAGSLAVSGTFTATAAFPAFLFMGWF
jgi:hypothetical protein